MRFTQAFQRLFTIIAVLGFLIALSASKTTTATSVSNVHPEPKVSFTFDDGFTSTIAYAAPALAKYGFKGTSYVIPDCIDTTGVCKADPSASYMDWEQVKQLQDGYGWEIGSHSLTHPSLTEVSASKQEQEMAVSKQALAARGIDAVSFASPYGDYNNRTLALAAKYYESHRGFWDRGYNWWPYSEYLVTVQQVQAGVSLEQVKQYVDTAIKNKQWLVLVFHDIKATPSDQPDDFEYSSTKLDQIAAYVKQKDVSVATINEGLVKSNVNLLSNSSFNNGLQNGWSTDTPANVRIDTNNNGNYPDFKNSLVLSSGSQSAHLFSPKLGVNANTTYMIKSFLNVTTVVSGEVGYYIDEYDGRGKWISGQWKNGEKNAFVENIGFAYRPSSDRVAKARLQVFLTPGSGIKAYVDNFQWFPMEE